MSHELNQMEITFGGRGTNGKVHELLAAWKRMNYSEIGVYSAQLTPKYQIWRAARGCDVVLPSEDTSENVVSFQPKPVVLSESEILKQEEKKLKNDNNNLQEEVKNLKFSLEVQTMKVQKLTQEQTTASQDLKELSQENEELKAKMSAPTAKRLLRKREDELEKAHKEIEFWKKKARVTKEQAMKHSDECKRWENMHSAVSSKFQRCLQDNEKLKMTIDAERARTLQKRRENEALRESVHTLEQELQSQKSDIMELLREYEERENDLMEDLYHARDDSTWWMMESFGRQQYIDHLTRQMHKAVSKAGEMIEKVKKLRRVVNPTGEYGQRLVNFLAEAQDQYEQIRCFYGYNSRMIDNV